MTREELFRAVGEVREDQIGSYKEAGSSLAALRRAGGVPGAGGDGGRGAGTAGGGSMEMDGYCQKLQSGR